MSVASLDCAWLNQAQALAAGAVGRSHASHARAWFRIGDVCLELVSDYQDLLDEFETRYRDCGLAERSQDLINIRCTAGYLPGTSLLWLSFDGSNLPDPMEAALTPFRMLRHLRRYVEQRGPVPGWRMLVNTEASNRTLAAGDSRTLVINLDESPPEFAADCIVSLVQSAQQGVLFLHAASFGIAGAGALLIGRSGAGKSTTSVALAFLRRAKRCAERQSEHNSKRDRAKFRLHHLILASFCPPPSPEIAAFSAKSSRSRSSYPP